MDANYTCYICTAAYHTNRHSCSWECRTDGDRVRHFDWCKRCRDLQLRIFENEVRKPKLRTEDK